MVQEHAEAGVNRQNDRGIGNARVSERRPARSDVAPGTRNHEVWGLSRERPGAEGPERIAPRRRASQGESAIPRGSIASEPSASSSGDGIARARVCRGMASPGSPDRRGIGASGPARCRPGPVGTAVGRLTLANGRPYHPPDDERADALKTKGAGAFVCLSGSDVDPGPSGEDRAQSR